MNKPWRYSLRDTASRGYNTVSTISLTVSESDSTRSSTTEISVHGKSADAPLVLLNVTSPSYMNVDRKLKIKATVDAEASGIATWSILSESGFNVTSGALTSLTNNINSGNNMFYLVMDKNILIVGETYMFTLTASTAGGTATSFSTAVIETNTPPVPGLLEINPRTGISLTTQFFFSAYLWDEQDLPVTYSLYYIDPISVLPIVIRSRSERTYGYSKLPMGDPALNYNITYGVTVYDGYDAYTNLNQIVRVNEQIENTTMVHTIIKRDLNKTAGDIDDMKKIVGTCVSALNVVNCT